MGINTMIVLGIFEKTRLSFFYNLVSELSYFFSVSI